MESCTKVALNFFSQDHGFLKILGFRTPKSRISNNLNLAEHCRFSKVIKKIPKKWKTVKRWNF